MKKRFLPLAVVMAGFAIAALLIATGPEVQPKPSTAVAPLVRVVEVLPKTVQLRTWTHGTVMPRTESDLVPEVDGRVVEVSPSLVSGGFFDKGDVLLRIETLDYEVALEQARAGLARAESDLQNARRTHKRQQDLVNRGATSDSQRDDALNRVRIAVATLREAHARLSRAERDLARTDVVAPYDGRVRSERVDVGQFVKRGTAVGTIYAVDFAEVRLPIHDAELAYLNLPLAQAGQDGIPPVPVTLRARFAGADHQWYGEVVRTEGELDPNTRMVNVVARVREPYVSRDGRPPLAVGLFVEVEIQGRTFPDLVVLPRLALRGERQVLIVDHDSRLRFRDVEVFRRTNDEVYISDGLQRGERVCISPLQSTADGMLVRLADEPSAGLAGGSARDYGS
ncbi:MAG: efflux RND transporter periplasmic adaptor subunit [Gammaproteobacteria bacterium]|nr:efflux RND transporter periplasmic adaptor subunit [Gammaproteobacteria bacterium]